MSDKIDLKKAIRDIRKLICSEVITEEEKEYLHEVYKRLQLSDKIKK